MQRSRKLAIAILAGVTMLGTGGVARAMSDGVYNAQDQNCDPQANDTHNANEHQEGCYNLVVHLNTGGREILRAGTMQTVEGVWVNELRVSSDFAKAGFPFNEIDPTQGARLYFGADDNLDHGEHDGSETIGNGPSDGGGIEAGIDPMSLEGWAAAMQAGNDPGYLQRHPIPLVYFGMGECADGVCSNVTTGERVVYQGGDEDSSRHASDYDGVTWDPESCGGPDETAYDEEGNEVCGSHDGYEDDHAIEYWNDQVGTVYAEPGVQVYEDPDPEGSPIPPYPLPGAYIGTCGVIVNAGDGSGTQGHYAC